MANDWGDDPADAQTALMERPAAAVSGDRGAPDLLALNRIPRGTANLFSSGRRSGQVGENLTTIRSNGGQEWTVNRDAAPAFQGFVNELEASGYPVISDGGYNPRKKRGSNTWSEHAFGNAIDVNSDENPMQGGLKTNLPRNVSDLAAKYGLTWGGDWHGTKDPMHFEWAGVPLAGATQTNAVSDYIRAANTVPLSTGAARGERSHPSGPHDWGDEPAKINPVDWGDEAAQSAKAQPASDALLRTGKRVAEFTGNLLEGTSHFLETLGRWLPSGESGYYQMARETAGVPHEDILTAGGKAAKEIAAQIQTDPSQDKSLTSKAIDIGVPAAGWMATAFANPSQAAVVVPGTIGAQWKQHATEQGATPEQQDKMQTLGEGFGLLAQIPFGEIISGLRLGSPVIKNAVTELSTHATDEALRPVIGSTLRQAIIGGGLKGAAGAAATTELLNVGENIGTRETGVNPDRGLLDGSLGSLAAGGFFGLMLGGIAGGQGYRNEQNAWETLAGAYASEFPGHPDVMKAAAKYSGAKTPDNLSNVIYQANKAMTRMPPSQQADVISKVAQKLGVPLDEPLVKPAQTAAAANAVKPQPSEPSPAQPAEPPPASPAQQQFESQLDTQSSVVRGAPASVIGTKGQEFPASYAWAPRPMIQPSHSGEMLAPNPSYPLTNTRDYTDPAEQDKALATRNTWDPRRAITDSPDASVGPPMVARVIDPEGNASLATVGGNNRQWAMQNLPADKWDATRELSNQKAAQFGLQPTTDPEHQLVRFMGSFDFRKPGEQDRLQGMVDALNPSPGMVQGTARRAQIDVANVPPEQLAGVTMDIAPNEAQTVVKHFIASGLLDRNLTAPIAESPAQSQDYVQRLLVNAAFRQPALAEARNDSRKGNETFRGIIDAAAPAMLALRQKGGNDVADAAARALTTTLNYLNRSGTDKLPQALAHAAQQTELDPAHAPAQALAGALQNALVFNKRGAVDAEPTLANVQQLFNNLQTAVSQHSDAPNLWGDTRSLAGTVQAALAPEGETLRVAEGPDEEPPRSSKAIQPLFATRAHTPVVQAKTRLRAEKYPLGKVAELVNNLYHKSAFAKLHGKDNAYLVLPSTSGENRIPSEFAARLQRDFGGEVIEGYARPTHKDEAKGKVHWLDKASDPLGYHITEDLRPRLAGKHVVLVDDIFTTGESIRALTHSLNRIGIRNITPVALAAKKGGHPAGPSDYKGLADKLARATRRDSAEIEQEIRLAYPHVYSDFLTRAVQDANAHPAEVAAAITRAADAVRAPAHGDAGPEAGGPAAPGIEGQRDIRGVPGLAAGETQPSIPPEGAGGESQLRLLETPSASQQMELTLAKAGVPAEKIPEALHGTARALSFSADPQLALPFQEPSLLRGGDRPRMARAADAGAGEREARRLESERARNRAITRLDQPFSIAQAFAGGDTISSIIPELVTGRLDAAALVGKIADSPAAWAMLTQQMRTPYAESLKAAALDNNGKIVAAEILSLGSVNESVVPMQALMNFARKARGMNAPRIIVSHNHPSGDPSPSSADDRVTVQIGATLEAAGANLHDHIITNGPRFYSFTTGEIGDVQASPAPWEVVPREALRNVDSPHLLAEMAGALRQGDPGHLHVAYLNTRLNLSAVERLPAGLSPRSFVQRIHDGIGREGAFAILLDLPDGEPQQVQFLIDRLKTNAAVRVLDVTTPSTPSFKEAGLVREGTLYEKPGNKLAVQSRALQSLREEPANYSPLQAVNDKGDPYASVPLAGLPNIKIVQMPEMVQLARDIAATIDFKRLPKSRGYAKGRRTVLDPRIFADPVSAAKTLAHELFHVVDYLPQEFLKRGNLWGRIHSLRSYMKERWTPGGPANAKLREELIALAQHWKPWTEDKSNYDKYRRSAVELYADFGSALLNSPATAKQFAPTFYREFFAGLDSKPDVKQAFFDLQQWLNRPAMQILTDRSKAVQQWFGKAEEIFERKMAERELRYRGYGGWLDRFKQAFYDVYQPIRSRAGGTPMETAVKFFFDAHPLAENRNYRMLENLHRTVVQPLEAAGHLLEDLGEYLFFNRVLNERYDIARKVAGEMQIETGGRSVIPNPGGHTPATARMGLLRMRLEKGAAGMAQMDAAAQKFHDTVFDLMRQAHKAGMLTDAQMQLIASNRDNYATFTPLEYVDTFVPSGIIHQAGTFKEIANPYISTVLKMITMQRAIELQNAKVLARDLLANHFPAEIERAQTRRDSSGRETPVPAKVKGTQQIMLREKGRPAWFNVPNEVAEMFNHGDVSLLRSAMEVLGAPWRNVLYPLYITFNPLFQLVRHPVREARRSFRNQPNELHTLSLYDTIGQNVRPELRAFVKEGKMSPLIAEMLENLAITPPQMDFISSNRRDAFGEILRQFNVLPAAERPKWLEARILQPALKLGHWIEQAGHINMLLPRVGVYKALVQNLGWSRADASFYVRNYIGVPNHLKKGKLAWFANDIFPFINVWSKGWNADFELARKGYQRASHPDEPGKSPASWWLRWAMTSGIWTLLKVAGSLGALGAGAKWYFDRISKHDKLNYDVLPLAQLPGGDFGGKALFMAIPQDQTDRLLSGLAFTFLTQAGQAMQGEGINPGGALGEMTQIGTSDMPGLNPMLKIVSANWNYYLRSQNPMDSFRGTPILTNDEYLAGGLPAAQKMLGWTYGQLGLQTFVHFNPQSNSTTETVLGSIPVVNGLTKTSDYGMREQQQESEHELDKRSAELRLSLDKDTQQLLQERGHLAGLRREVRTPEQSGRLQVINQWYFKTYRPLEAEMLQMSESGMGTDAVKSQLKSTAQPYLQRR